MTAGSFAVDLVVGVIAAVLAYGAYRLGGNMLWALLVLAVFTVGFIWLRSGPRDPDRRRGPPEAD